MAAELNAERWQAEQALRGHTAIFPPEVWRLAEIREAFDKFEREWVYVSNLGKTLIERERQI